MKLSEYLFEQRLNACKSIQEYAKDLGISMPNYLAIEHGKKKQLQYKTINKLCSFYGISPREINQMLREESQDKYDNYEQV